MPRSAVVGGFSFRWKLWLAFASPSLVFSGKRYVYLVFHAVSCVGVVCALQSNLKLQRTRETRGMLSPSVVGTWTKMPLVASNLRALSHSSTFYLDTIVHIAIARMFT